MLSRPRYSSAFGPTKRSPSNAPAITRTCFGRPMLIVNRLFLLMNQMHFLGNNFCWPGDKIIGFARAAK